MNKRLQILWFVLFFSSLAYGQNQANNWFFGFNAGLTFNTNPISVLNNSALLSTEGSAAISTAEGNLLFYTNGQTVWNKLNKPMPNGSGLVGNSNTTQSAIIVPKPKSKNIYYVFTLDDLGGSNGLSYSEVDMNLDGGLGSITSNKNIFLQSALSEKLTAIRHGNGTDYWVLVHGNNSKDFLAFKITENGVQVSPIKSTVGSIHPNLFGTIGYMKFSPNGEKVACAVGGTGNFVEVLDFDDLTGKLSNAMRLDFTDAPYGIEFSPNSEKLYTSAGSSIFQYTIPPITNESLLSISQKEIGVNAPVWALQLGPDKKIYACKQGKSLAVISSPNNEIGTINFQDDDLNIFNTAIQGFPNFLQNYFNDNFIAAHNTCVNQTTSFEILLNDIDSVFWDFGDKNTASAKRASHTYTLSGKYVVKATIYSGSHSETITKVVDIKDLPSFSLGNDTILCKGEALNYDLAMPSAKYLWNNGQISPKRTISTPGVHYLDVTQFGCTLRDSINIVYDLINPDFSINNPTQCLDNNHFKYSSSATTAKSSNWYIDNIYADEGLDFEKAFIKTGLFKVKHVITSNNNCSDSALKEVSVNATPKSNFVIQSTTQCGKNNSYTFTNTTSYTGDYDFEFIIEGKTIKNKSPLSWTFSSFGEKSILLKVKTAKGCDDITEKTVKVYPSPIADILVSANSICLNDNSFDVSLQSAIKLYETINWQIDGNDFTPANDSNFTHSFATIGKHTITLKITNSLGCETTTTEQIEVVASPTVDFTTTKNATSCLGTKPISFVNLTNDKLVITDYDWNFGDNTKSTDVNPTKAYNSQAQHIVTLTATNEAGCKSVLTKTINSYEQPEIAINTKTINACESSNAFEISYTNSNTAAGISKLVWQSSNGTSIPQQSPAPVSFPQAGEYTITLNAETLYGCTDEATTTISVYPSPTGNLIINNNEQCVNNNAFVIEAPKKHSNDIAITNYTWNLGSAVGNAIDNTASLNFDKAGDYDIEVDITDEKGCSAKLHTTLTVHPAPEFTILKKQACVGSPVTLEVDGISNFVIVTNWSWDLGDGSTASVSSPDHIYKKANSYPLTATATTDKGCKYTSHIEKGVEVSPIPVASFEHEKISWGFAETVIKFKASSSINNSTFSWDFDNTQTGTNTVEHIKYTEAGYYTVKLTATSEKGCAGNTSKTILIVPPFDAYVPTSFTPNGDGINDVFGMEGVEFINTYNMQIFNRWGQIVFTSNDLKKQWDGRLNNSPLPADMYSFAIKLTDAEDRPYKISGTIQLIR